MYTELHFNCHLLGSAEVPRQVVDVLEFMVGSREEEPVELPEHPLFSLPRWRYMLTCSSAHFDAPTCSSLTASEYGNHLTLSVRSNFKNYDGEIEAFLDWIDPYLDACPGDFLGFHRYEETQDPTLIRKRA